MFVTFRSDQSKLVLISTLQTFFVHNMNLNAPDSIAFPVFTIVDNRVYKTLHPSRSSLYPEDVNPQVVAWRGQFNCLSLLQFALYNVLPASREENFQGDREVSPRSVTAISLTSARQHAGISLLQDRGLRQELRRIEAIKRRAYDIQQKVTSFQYEKHKIIAKCLLHGPR